MSMNIEQMEHFEDAYANVVKTTRYFVPEYLLAMHLRWITYAKHVFRAKFCFCIKTFKLILVVMMCRCVKDSFKIVYGFEFGLYFMTLNSNQSFYFLLKAA